MSQDAAWMEPIIELVGITGLKGGIIVLFPEYRPDLAKSIAARLGLRFYDYRAEDLRRLGTGAYKVELRELDDVLERLSLEGGAVVFNVEALLATKDSEERGRWLSSFLNDEWPGLLLIPMTLFSRELQATTARVVHLEAEQLPEQSLISRFLH